MQPGPPRRRRARPVADAPLDQLLIRAEDLAKGWLLALLEEAPLDEAPGILATDLALDGPRICEAVLRALADDSDLRRLEPGGALVRLVSRVGELAGARSLEATLRSVDALQAVLWSALRHELTDPDSAQISELAERLALVIEFVRGASLRRDRDEGTAAGRPVAAAPAAAAPGAGAPRAATTGAATPAPSSDPAAQAAASAPAGMRSAEPTPADPAATAAPHPPAAPAAPHLAVAPEAPHPPAPDPLATTTAADRAGRDEPEAVAEALWVGAFAEEIQRAEHSGTPLSLLLAELEDADRVAAVEEPALVTVTFGRFAQAVRTVARRQDLLVCETPTRAWIIARDTARPGAQALGARIASAVREGPAWRGAPMMASVGVSVLGEDGRSTSELIEAAEVARLGAAASGIGIIRAMPREPPSEPPPEPGPWLAG